MGTFKKYDIEEEISVQINLSNYLPSDHLCRQIEKIVSELEIGIIESTYSALGQNAYHPKMLLSLIFYGYAVGIRSGRKLSTACKEDLAFMYLSKSYQISKSVFNDFRQANYLHFTNLFNQVLQKCLATGLADPSLSIIDGSKIRANSAKKATKTQEKYEKWRTFLLEDIASLKKEIASLDSPQVELKKN